MVWIDPLYERLGGMPAVAALVFSFYERVARTKELAPYFEGVEMRLLIDHQTKFLAALMGGPPSYTNEHLRQLHAHLAIEGQAFDRMVELLGETLHAFRMPDEDADRVLAALHARRSYIVSAPGDGRRD